MKRFAIYAIACAALYAGCGSDAITPRAADWTGGGATKRAHLAQTVLGASPRRPGMGRRIRATGTHYEPMWSPSPDDPDHVRTSYAYTSIEDPVTGRTRARWDSAIHDEENHLEYTEVYDDHDGRVQGVDSFLAGPSGRFTTARVIAQRKHALLFAPDRLLQLAEHAGARLERGDQRDEEVLVIAAQPAPIRLVLDRPSGVPRRAETTEDDPIYGDANIAAVYDDWRPVAGGLQPFHIRYWIGDQLFDDEARTEIDEVPIVAADFALPGEAAPADAPLAQMAVRSAGWFSRMQMGGWPSLSQNTNVTLTDLAPGVVHVTGGSHHSMVVEMRDHLVLVEAPQHETRSLAVLAALAARFPGKRVRQVVNTHFHFDHSGGVRTIVAQGATLVTSAVNRGFFARVLTAPHELVPDRLEAGGPAAGAAALAQMCFVGDRAVLTDGERRVELYDLPSQHTRGLLGVYLPAERLYFVADVYVPLPPGAARPLPPGWRRAYADETLTAIEARGLDVATLVGAHGSASPLADLRVAAARR
jgi:glyoxylase-like metal-dependent hydrolase (beta-lactamase superfamily II)